MKLASTDRINFSSGLKEEASFTIKASAKAFKVLSSSLYQDPIAAVIREISCNAWDAHIAAGTTDTPFYVQLPTWAEKIFLVRDYGTGMPHDAVMHMYSTFFDSDKDHSNDFVGGLGIGSKSPFSYQDQFTVRSFYEGKVNTYTAYLDAEGLPKIALLNSIDTDEANGMEVSFPVRESSLNEFERKAINVYNIFPVKPDCNILGEDDYTYNPDEWESLSDVIYTKADRGAGESVRIIQGNVLYTVSKSVILSDIIKPESSEYEYKIIEEYLTKNMVEMRVPIGTISFQPSRESITFDKMTTESVVEFFKVVVDYAVDYIESFGDDFASIWAMSRHIRENIYSLSFSLDTFLSIAKFKGTSLKGEFPLSDKFEEIKDSISNLTIKHCWVEYNSSDITGIRSIEDRKDLTLKYKSKLKVYVDDISSYGNTRIKESHYDRYCNVIVIRPVLTVDEQTIEDEIQLFCDELGITVDEIKRTSAMCLSNTELRKTQKHYSGYGIDYDSEFKTKGIISLDKVLFDCNQTIQSDIGDEKGYYITRPRAKFEHRQEAQLIIAILRYLAHKKIDSNVYIIATSSAKRINAEQWINIEELVNPERVNVDQYKKRCNEYSALNELGGYAYGDFCCIGNRHDWIKLGFTVPFTETEQTLYNIYLLGRDTYSDEYQNAKKRYYKTINALEKKYYAWFMMKSNEDYRNIGLTSEVKNSKLDKLIQLINNDEI